MPISVVLPLPEGPTIAHALPASTENETSLSTQTISAPLLNSLLKCSTLRMTLALMLAIGFGEIHAVTESLGFLC